MKLTRKLTIALVLGILAVLGVSAAVLVRREVVLVQRDVERDHQILGRSMAAATERIWSATTTPGDREIAPIELRNSTKGDLEITWFRYDRGAARWLGGASPPDAVRVVLLEGHEERQVVEADDGDELVTYFPIHDDDGHTVGAVELRESLEPARAYLRQTIFQMVLTTMAIVGLCGILALALGVHFVGRPVRRLVVAARRIGAGHLRGEINLPQNDELGELGAEMNAMCQQLIASRDKADQEAAARLAAVEQLRHAERLTTVGKLASGIAHELGTPLNVVGVRAQLLMREHPRGTGVHEHALSILEQIERMSVIIRQLLDFARRRQAHTSRQDVRQLARQTVAMLRALAEKRGVTVRVEGDDAIHASVDAGPLQQALTNLIVNGLEATPAGGNLTIAFHAVETTPPPDVGGAPGEFLVIRVTDDGSGMAPDVAARVFEPFFTTKEVGQGTGLGLSVTHGIVRDHGGWMTLETEVGKGSRFSIFLPLERAS